MYSLIVHYKYNRNYSQIDFTNSRISGFKGIQSVLNEETYIKHPLLSNHVTFSLFHGTYWTADSLILPRVPPAFNSVQS